MSQGGNRPLPEGVEACIRRVLDATELQLPDRHEVERDLRAHFEDGLDAGTDAALLVERFGDPVEAGRRIGAARRRTDRRSHGTGRWGMRWDAVRHEMRRSVRGLVRSPGYGLVVVFTLALGVGANTAVFTVLDAVLLAPLPYENPDGLVRLYEAPPGTPSGGDLNNNYVRAATAVAYRGWDDVFSDLATVSTYRELGADLTDGDLPTRITTGVVSAGYFETLGIRPLVGRTFTDDESLGTGDPADSRVGAPTAILSHRLWQERYGGDRSILGSTILLSDQPFTVVGVMPPDFRDPIGPPADVWLPQDLRQGRWNSYDNYYLTVVARLRDGVTLDAAQERLDTRYAQLRDEVAEAGDWGPVIRPLHDDLVGSARRTMLWLLAGAAGLVLLSACVNVANLVFARALERSRDVAVRAALGSSRGGIVLGSLVEGGILALCGGFLGLGVGWLGVRGLLALAPDALPALTIPTLSVRVFAVALGSSVAALGIFGLLPALRMARTPPSAALRSGARGSTGGRGMKRLRDALVVAQVAASLALLAGAALLGRSFLRLQAVDLAVEPQGVLTYEIHLPDSRYPDGAARHGFHRQMTARVADLPGVRASGGISWLPVNGRYNIWGFKVTPEEGSEDTGFQPTDVRVIVGDYFSALGIDVVRGVPPAAVDPEGEPVVWINQTVASSAFAGRDPLGQTMLVANDQRRVVGIVEDAAYDTRGGRAPTSYVLHAQFADNRNWALTHTTRVAGDPAGMVGAVRRVLARLDPALVLHRPRAMTDVMAAGLARDRFAMLLMGAFAGLALLLTLVGTYGVLTRTVAGRSREIGIRMALGADGTSVRGMVVRYAGGMAILGVAFGLAAAWYGSRWIEALLFGVGASDPVAYAAAAALVMASCLVAGWLPAWRASRVDPARTLAGD